MPTPTTNLSMSKPDIGQSNWGTLMNTNLDTLDALFPSGVTNAGKLQGNPVSATAPTPTYVLTWNGSSWVPAALPATGVTSVGLSVPSWLTVTGSPVTGAGTLAVTASSGQTQNQFLATPNGSTGAVGLRSLASADIPNNAANTTGSAGSLLGTATSAALISENASNVWLVRNGTTAQKFGVSSTYTDISNHREFNIYDSGGNFFAVLEKVGSPGNQDLFFGNNAGGRLLFRAAGTNAWQIQATAGNPFFASTDNTSDIGATGANRPRNIYAAGQILVASGSGTAPGFAFDGATSTGVAQSGGNLYLCTPAASVNFNNGASVTGSFSTGTGLFSNYAGLATAGQGLAVIRGSLSGVTQAAAVATTNLYATAPAGLYRVNYYLAVSQAATTSSACQITISWTDGTGTAQTFVGTSLTANTVGTKDNNSIAIESNGSNITIAISYSSTGATAMQYRYRATAERTQ